MFDLVKKDFIIAGIFLGVIAVVIPFLTMMAVLTMIDEFGGLVLGFFIPMIIVFCIGSSFIFLGIDESYKADTIYASLPVKLWKIVVARYFTSFIMIISSFALMALTSLVSLHLFQKTDPLLMLFFSIRGMMSTTLFLLLILTFYLPFLFKFGSSKGISAALLTQICLVLIIPTGKFVFKAVLGIFAFDLSFFSGLFGAIRDWVMGLRPDETYVLIFMLLVFATLVSMGLSVRFYKKRDL
jgi:hypothetical protein